MQWHHTLLYLRSCMIFSLHNRLDKPPQNVDSLVDTLFELALNEDRAGTDWQERSYVHALACVRADMAQRLFERMQKVRGSDWY